MKKKDEVVVDFSSFIYVNWDIKSFLDFEKFAVEGKVAFLPKLMFFKN